MGNRFILHQNTDTQRVSVSLGEETTLVSKDWRKSAGSEWTTGKGITISNECLILLGKILSSTKQEQDILISQHFERLKEDEH